MKRFLYKQAVLIIVSFSFITACTNSNEVKKEKPPVSVDVLIVAQSHFSTPIEVNGTVLPEEMIELHSETGGKIVFLNIPDGAYVTAGTVLAKINDAELQAQLLQQKSQYDIAKKNEQSLKKLLSINGVNQLEYDAAVSQVNSYKANIQVIEAQIEKTIVRAPFNGKLGLRNVSLGAYVTPQTVLGTLQQSDKIKIDFNVPDVYSKYIQLESKVQIKPTGSDSAYTAIIQAIDPSTNKETGNIKVRARLTQGNIIPGSFVKVIIPQKENGILIPSNAIIPDATSNQVIKVTNGKADFVNVQTGNRNENNIVILQGISEGDSIVVGGVLFVRPKSSLSIRKIITKLEDLQK